MRSRLSFLPRPDLAVPAYNDAYDNPSAYRSTQDHSVAKLFLKSRGLSSSSFACVKKKLVLNTYHERRKCCDKTSTLCGMNKNLFVLPMPLGGSIGNNESNKQPAIITGSHDHDSSLMKDWL